MATRTVTKTVTRAETIEEPQLHTDSACIVAVYDQCTYRTTPVDGVLQRAVEYPDAGDYRSFTLVETHTTHADGTHTTDKRIRMKGENNKMRWNLTLLKDID